MQIKITYKGSPRDNVYDLVAQVQVFRSGALQIYCAPEQRDVEYETRIYGGTMYIYYTTIPEGMRDRAKLQAQHTAGWREIWERGRVDVGGNPSLATAAYSALYYILSSMPVDQHDPSWPFIGLSPGGLAHGPREEVRRLTLCSSVSLLSHTLAVKHVRQKKI